MSNSHLPADILDHVVDHLHNTQDALRNCCLVSKSWVPRTRKYLFADIRFRTAENLRSWKETFPDPSTSPAYYAKTIFIRCPEAVVAADAEVDGWIRGFSRVEHLVMGSRDHPGDEWKSSLVPFHGISPAVKSLHMVLPAFPSSHIFDLILSFPLLEDLAVTIHEMRAIDYSVSKEGEMQTAVYPPSTPIFAGSLELYLRGGMEPLTRRLLSLPSGIHFRKLTFTCLRKGDLSSTTALVEGCSHTLESLDISWGLLDGPESSSIDLSKATKLKDVVFRLISWSVQWVITAFQTIIPKHRDLRQITIDVSYYSSRLSVGVNIKRVIGEADRGQWSDLDRLLVQLSELRSIRPEVICTAGRQMRHCVRRLLPELTKGGMIDLIQR